MLAYMGLPDITHKQDAESGEHVCTLSTKKNKMG